MTSTAPGWAVVKNNGLIYIKTVSDTRRAAIINWLVSYHQVPVFAYHTDTDIEHLWQHYGKYSDCLPVMVSLIPPAHRNSEAT